MNCARARECFSELLDPRSNPAEASSELADARAHLSHCPECQRDYSTLAQTLEALDALPVPAPTPRLRQQFYAMLEEEKHSAASVQHTVARRQRTQWWAWIIAPLGAAALVAAGFYAGARLNPAPAPQTIAVVDPETKRELHELRTKLDRVEAMNQLVATTLQHQQQQPANERLRGVLTSAALEKPDNRVIDELITSLALDPSANVRLRALEALYPHADQDVVRAGVLASLPRESNPMVQVAMIDFLAGARDHEAKSALERMSANDLTDRTVREAAKRALAQL
jgi:hypothetical protein